MLPMRPRPWHRTCGPASSESSMDIQPAKQSVKRWPVRAAPPKAESAGVDPMPPNAGPIRGARAPFCVLWLFVPTVLLLLGSAYWLSTLWAHALIQREAEATATIVQPELQRVPFARILDPKQREK